ncbi:hypothetical protein B0H17DRAFT_1164057 [Mycena rosella]|uniref:CxC2-like cysteine cluster KDZ transposase-associated domain-containing protein n=1 Tax=Mycena rosella TaxID=1033263 RepID=A0AAD7FQS8_MYCRO|nr:hypothetical protein B0H17DRAFT_1164057 [Mycena rosella]
MLKTYSCINAAQNGQLLDDFGEHLDDLGSLLLESEADEDTALQCACPSGLKRTTQCFDCTGYPATCEHCFVKAHIHNPFHWAEVWNRMAGFFVWHDISKLGHTIQLGHKGGQCPQSIGGHTFTVVDAFRGCKELPPNKIKQPMRAGLFPATTKDPHTAFTISMLKEFQLHNLESKKAVYDYLGAIRRLTDNSFTSQYVHNPYAAFLRVVRVFNFLSMKKRSGQFYGIDAVLPHRPAGNLLVWCPACPKPGTLEPNPTHPRRES